MSEAMTFIFWLMSLTKTQREALCKSSSEAKVCDDCDKYVEPYFCSVCDTPVPAHIDDWCMVGSCAVYSLFEGCDSNHTMCPRCETRDQCEGCMTEYTRPEEYADHEECSCDNPNAHYTWTPEAQKEVSNFNALLKECDLYQMTPEKRQDVWKCIDEYTDGDYLAFNDNTGRIIHDDRCTLPNRGIFEAITLDGTVYPVDIMAGHTEDIMTAPNYTTLKELLVSQHPELEPHFKLADVSSDEPHVGDFPLLGMNTLNDTYLIVFDDIV